MSTIKNEADRCLKCKNAMCVQHCPINTPIPEIMAEFCKGDLQKAGSLLIMNNPLSAITSVVCPHENNCCGHCVLGRRGEPVEFYRVEQYISSLYLETAELPEIEKNGKRVAVIGAGPSGITASMVLAYTGFDVTLFEADSNIGGVLRYGIPGFRLSKDILALYKDLLERLGVKLRLNVHIGSNIDVNDLLLDGYAGIFVGTGVGTPNKMGILGETLGNVHYAINYLKSPKEYKLGKKVVVVGAGNVAMDAARTAIRKNHARVVLLNCRAEEDMTASREEVELSELEGVAFMHKVQLVKIEPGKVRCVGVNKNVDENGKVTYTEDFSEHYDLEADSVILAIGQGPEAESSYGSLDLGNRGLIAVDETGRTSNDRVWASGDIVTGASTVVQAVALTMKTVGNMIQVLSKE